jgi:hypothetical protein
MLGGAGSGRAWGSNTDNPRYFVSTYNTRSTMECHPSALGHTPKPEGAMEGLGCQRYYTTIVRGTAQGALGDRGGAYALIRAPRTPYAT